MRGFSVCAVLLASTMAVAAPAQVVDDPVPGPPAPGVTVGIERFVTIPASSPNRPRARIQYVTPFRDGSGRLVVNDTRGVLWATNPGGATPTSYLDLRTAGVGFQDIGAEGGLLGVAFHPLFARAGSAGFGKFYTHHTATVGSGVARYLDDDAGNNHDVVIQEWTVADPFASSATIASTREVLRVGHFAGNHNGGTISFNTSAQAGDGDFGNLYIGWGDGGGANDPRNYGQNLAVPLGKILRINPLDPDGAGALTYGTPGDNPFVGQAGALAENWAYGLRNPQQFSWDSTGRMFISDIGQAQLEEVNLGQAGGNYGWVLREGTFAKSPDKNNTDVFLTPANDGRFLDPIAQYDHDEGRSIGGGFLYEGDDVPLLFGKFVLTDNPTGRIFYFDPDEAVGGVAPLSELFLTLQGASFVFARDDSNNGRVDLRLGVDEDGELYLLSKANGNIYRFAAQAVPEPASWALMIAGFGLAGAALRRRAKDQVIRSASARA